MMTVAKVDSGLYVASREGEYHGYIDTTADGHFVAFNGHSEPVGRYTTLAAATAALNDPPVSTVERRARFGEIATVATGSLLGMAAIAAGLVVSFV
jgi:hypothetical protein